MGPCGTFEACEKSQGGMHETHSPTRTVCMEPHRNHREALRPLGSGLRGAVSQECHGRRSKRLADAGAVSQPRSDETRRSCYEAS